MQIIVILVSLLQCPSASSWMTINSTKIACSDGCSNDSNGGIVSNIIDIVPTSCKLIFILTDDDDISKSLDGSIDPESFYMTYIKLSIHRRHQPTWVHRRFCDGMSASSSFYKNFICIDKSLFSLSNDSNQLLITQHSKTIYYSRYLFKISTVFAIGETLL